MTNTPSPTVGITATCPQAQVRTVPSAPPHSLGTKARRPHFQVCLPWIHSEGLPGCLSLGTDSPGRRTCSGALPPQQTRG